MATLVLTVIGNDKSGLVDALSGVIADHGGNWDKSHMARLAGKFAGIVMVTIADGEVDALIADLEPLEAQGLLDVHAERADDDDHGPGATIFTLDLVGQDHPGIVHDISHALAARNVSITELRTAVVDAPMAGGTLFEAQATLVAPSDTPAATLRRTLEALANELMVDIELK